MKENKSLSFTIYYALQAGPHSINSLLGVVKNAGYAISARSIYRHIEKIEFSLDPSIEKLEVVVGAQNRKTYFISQISKSTSMLPKSNSEWVDLIVQQNLFLKTAHQYLVNESNSSSLLDNLLKQAPLYVKEIGGLNSFVNSFKNSEFGQAILTSVQKKILIDLLWCIEHKICFSIIEFEPLTIFKHDVLPELNEHLCAIKMVYHRGDFILNLVSEKRTNFYSFELDKIKKIKIINTKSLHQMLFEEFDTDSNFGHHTPICQTVFKIKLLFPPTPGGYVRNRKWHHSQKSKILKNGDIEIEFNCRICIELLGWIMMWMDNVQVLSPPKLIELLEQRIDNMAKINKKRMKPINNNNNLVEN